MRSLSLYVILLLILCSFALAAEEGFYIVKKGDTLSKISRETGIPVDILIAVNKIKNPQNITPGQKLLIPQVYLVKKGDTIYSISKNHNFKVDEILSLNKIAKDQPLKINQKIYLPIPNSYSSELKAKVEDTAKPQSIFWPHSGNRENYDGKIRGVLIKGNKGDLIYSVSSGRVIWAGPYRGYGNVVFITTEDGLIYGYLGNDELIVNSGERVEAGTALARLGVYFHSFEAKLLFFIYSPAEKTYLEPAKILAQSAKR